MISVDSKKVRTGQGRVVGYIMSDDSRICKIEMSIYLAVSCKSYTFII